MTPFNKIRAKPIRNCERSERMKFFKEGLGENFLQKIVPQWYAQPLGEAKAGGSNAQFRVLSEKLIMGESGLGAGGWDVHVCGEAASKVTRGAASSPTSQVTHPRQ